MANVVVIRAVLKAGIWCRNGEESITPLIYNIFSFGKKI
jgi:hypothetical protein